VNQKEFGRVAERKEEREKKRATEDCLTTLTMGRRGRKGYLQHHFIKLPWRSCRYQRYQCLKVIGPFVRLIAKISNNQGGKRLARDRRKERGKKINRPSRPGLAIAVDLSRKRHCGTTT